MKNLQVNYYYFYIQIIIGNYGNLKKYQEVKFCFFNRKIVYFFEKKIRMIFIFLFIFMEKYHTKINQIKN